jgi:hypothetical protein
VLGFDWAGAAVANDLKLGVCGRKKESAGDEQQRAVNQGTANAANGHQSQL